MMPNSALDPQLEAKAVSKFGRNMWHSIGTLKPTPDRKGKCYWCDKPAQEEPAMVNIWGTVWVTPACAECHKKNDGIARDDL